MLILLFTLATFTSIVAALIGFGGGMLLLAVLPFLLPASAIIPLHGVSQLASNSSRFVFGWQHIYWPVLLPFVIGSSIGVAFTSQLLSQVPAALWPVLIGSYMLLSLWGPSFNRLATKAENFYLLGALQSGLALFVGAPGPLSTPLLIKRCANHQQVIVTAALLMTISHLLKIIIFGVHGFDYLDFGWPLAALIAGAILGSWLGTRWRADTDSARAKQLIKGLLSLLALSMLGRGVYQLLA